MMKMNKFVAAAFATLAWSGSAYAAITVNTQSGSPAAFAPASGITTTFDTPAPPPGFTLTGGAIVSGDSSGQFA